MALWQRMLDVNLTGTFLCAQAALAGMLHAGYGRIVNIASTAGLAGDAYVAAYCAAKHGVIGLTRALALEFARKNITVNAVCPGYTETDMVGAAVANIVAKTGRSADEARAELVRAQSAGPPDAAGGSRQRRAVAVPAGQRSDHRPGDCRRGRRGDVRTRKAVRARATAFEQHDLETRVNDQHHQALKLWLRLLACTTQIEGEIRGRLRSKFDTTLPRFDLMAQLERDPAGLKMSELSRA